LYFVGTEAEVDEAAKAASAVIEGIIGKVIGAKG
jgi:hypothetical protein